MELNCRCRLVTAIFGHGDEENGRRACTGGHLTTADQSEICGAYLASVEGTILLCAEMRAK